MTDRRFYALLIWTILMALIVMGLVLSLVHPELAT